MNACTDPWRCTHNGRELGRQVDGLPNLPVPDLRPVFGNRILLDLLEESRTAVESDRALGGHDPFRFALVPALPAPHKRDVMSLNEKLCGGEIPRPMFRGPGHPSDPSGSPVEHNLVALAQIQWGRASKNKLREQHRQRAERYPYISSGLFQKVQNLQRSIGCTGPRSGVYFVL
jgi:hypothetical protein